MFADVELEAGDKAHDLAALGLRVQRKAKMTAFAQPCSCFAGKWCKIYRDRPARCRAFECGTLKRVQAAQLSPTQALSLIGQAQRQVKEIRNQLRQLGNNEEHLPLSRRYARVMAQPLDLAGDEGIVEMRAQLMLNVDALMKLIQRQFLH